MNLKLPSGFILPVLLAVIYLTPNFATAQAITLVRFGDSMGTTTYGLAGWSTILKSNNQNFTAQGNGGLVASYDAGEYGDYRGIRGTMRKFNIGERIVVTWYNNSDETFNFTARISFTDDDEPNVDAPDGKWYTMRSFSDYRETYSAILPHSTTKTVFNITDSGVHKTDETFSLVNINLAVEWGSTYQKQFLICEKIELLNDADIIPPSQPTGVAATVISDSKVQLNWNPTSDNVEVIEYLIYLNNEIEGYSRSNNYTSVYLEPDQQYEFTVTALDAVGNESIQSEPVRATILAYQGRDDLLNPAGLEYVGAIALPEQYSWGGEAIAYNGDGDPAGASDGYPGSLFVTNLNQPKNGLVGEITIPAPIISPQKDVTHLNEAITLVQPVNIRPANVNNWDYVDIWRTGLEYIAEEKRLYSSWSIHYTVSGEKHASISCCDATDLAGSSKHGAWYIGDANQLPIDAMMNDWLFALPQQWADANCSGRNLVVGRCRDGGLSGLGPTLYAFSTVGTVPPPANSELEFTTLLEYGSVEGTDNYHFPHSIDGYKHSDDWREAMWLTAANQNAVAIVGNKALGHNWYGYNGENMQHDWVIADVPYPDFWETDPDGKGWRAHNRLPMIIFFDPAELAKVAEGQIPSYQPQPYTARRIPKNIFFGATHEIFSAAFNAKDGILFVTEFVRELEGKLLLHTWKVNPVTSSVPTATPMLTGFELEQNYPNPFNPKTIITYHLPQTSHIRLVVYDLLGRHIKTLVDTRQPAGHFRTIWDGNDEHNLPVAAGVYFCRMEAGDYVRVIKLAIIK